MPNNAGLTHNTLKMNKQAHKAELRSKLRQRQLRRHFIRLTVKEHYSSANAVRLVAKKFALSEARMFVIIRPADVRKMLANDWEGTMKEHSLDLPRPTDVEVDPLEGDEV